MRHISTNLSVIRFFMGTEKLLVNKVFQKNSLSVTYNIFLTRFLKPCSPLPNRGNGGGSLWDHTLAKEARDMLLSTTSEVPPTCKKANLSFLLDFSDVVILCLAFSSRRLGVLRHSLGLTLASFRPGINILSDGPRL